MNSDDYLFDVSSPGEILFDWIQEQGFEYAAFAEKADITPQVLKLIIEAQVPLTIELCEKLSTATNISTQFWINLENLYRESVAVIRHKN